MWLGRLVPLAVLLFAAWHETGASDGFRAHERYTRVVPQAGRTDVIARWLESRVEPGDRIQPLDWVWGGTLQAMLETRVPLATPYIYYAYLQHHVSDPYIQHHRARLLERLQEEPPRYIIKVRRAQPFFMGKDTSRHNQALQNWINETYEITSFQRRWATIYEYLPEQGEPGEGAAAGTGSSPQ